MIDGYTKFILTVIAIALAGNLASTLVGRATAQVNSVVQKVVICSAHDFDVCARVEPGRPYPGNNRGTLAVTN